jgi:hypothetical protein
MLGQQTYPLEVEYDLLDVASGKACDGKEYLRGDKSPDPAAVGDGRLFEEAKFAAIHQVAGTDGLVAVRTKVEWSGDRQCVTVIGRAYRLLSIRATQGHRPGERTTIPIRKLGPADDEPAPVPSIEVLPPTTLQMPAPAPVQPPKKQPTKKEDPKNPIANPSW